MKFNLIVATDLNGGIGKDNMIPWHFKEDMKYFKSVTTETTSENKKNAVIMGRKTWESLPEKYKPLPNRINIVLSRKNKQPSVEGVFWLNDFNQIKLILEKLNNIETVWIIGGSSIYKKALEYFDISFIYQTIIFKKYDCDKYFEFQKKNYVDYKKNEVVTPKNTVIQFNIYKKMASYINNGEKEYLNLVKHILENGAIRKDRTGVGTLSVFGTQMRFDISKSIPLLTTKKVFFRGVVEELLWFLRGQTNVRTLQDKKVRIWDGNSTPEYLETVGLSHLKNGDLGPIYGFQWRSFGAKYDDGQTDYTGCGVDQIRNVIDQIKNNPTSRRIILSAWNPVDISAMALPPCHILYQFYVNDGRLSCHMYQRSGDVGLGVPFNIASTSVLTYILAKVCNLLPGEVVHSIGDAHIYSNHVEAMKQQLERQPYKFPQLEILKDINSIEDIEKLEYNDFKLYNYKYHPSIKMKMAV